jgi:hypothetical protein
MDFLRRAKGMPRSRLQRDDLASTGPSAFDTFDTRSGC